MSDPETRSLIHVSISRYEKTGLLVGMSHDLKGLHIAGRSHDELLEEAPLAIKVLLEASGERVGSVDRMDRDFPGWISGGMVYAVSAAAS